MKYDIIIIGAGLGGLTAGQNSPKRVKKYYLSNSTTNPEDVQQHLSVATLPLKSDLHEMDGPSPRDMKTRIFNELDVSGKIEFIKVPEFYRFYSDRYDIVIPHDPVEAIRKLKDIFPSEAEGIDAYFNQILYPKRKPAENEIIRDYSVGEFLDSIIRDEDLKLILLGNLGYFHDDPYSLSLTYYSVAQGSYFNGGASFIKGGSQKLSDHLADFINQHGGKVLLNHLVTRIISDTNKLTGVEFKNQKDPSESTLTAFADEIIANNALPNLVTLLPAEMGEKLNNEIGSQRPGASLLTIYFGFRSLLNKIGHNNYSTFVFDRSVKTQKDILRNNKGDFLKRCFTFIDYGQIDSGLAPMGKSVGALCCIDYPNDWKDLNKEQYKAKKEEVAKIFINRLENLIPGISGEIEYYEVGTSLTINRYTLNPDGAVYGFAQTPDRRTINISDIIENLHFASAWGKTGGGFSGAIYSGFLCAYNIIRKRG